MYLTPIQVTILDNLTETGTLPVGHPDIEAMLGWRLVRLCGPDAREVRLTDAGCQALAQHL